MDVYPLKPVNHIARPQDRLMHIIKIDCNNGIISIDSVPLTVGNNGTLGRAIVSLCSAPIHMGEKHTRYRLADKASILGNSADVVIDICERRCTAIFLFDFVEFFQTSILESKILRTLKKSLKTKFLSNHPSTAILDCEWGQARFIYDPKLGDLSLEISFEQGGYAEI